MSVKVSNNRKDIISVPRQNAFVAIRIICMLIVLYEHFVVLTGFELPCLGLRERH